MNKYILYLLVAIIPMISTADEKSMKILDKAYMNALNRDFKEAIDKALPLLNSLALNKIDEIVLAHQVLTASFCELGNKEKTKEHLTALKAFSPDEDFRAFNLSASCQKLIKEFTPSTKHTKKTKR